MFCALGTNVDAVERTLFDGVTLGDVVDRALFDGVMFGDAVGAPTVDIVVALGISEFNIVP